MKNYTAEQQEKLVVERLRLKHAHLVDLTPHGPENVSFPLTLSVEDDWLRMRAGLRAAHAE